jgi:hypothetical protein
LPPRPEAMARADHVFPEPLGPVIAMRSRRLALVAFVKRPNGGLPFEGYGWGLKVT